MANPFYIEPVNLLEKLMAGQQGYDAAKKRADADLLSSIGDQIGTGNLDYNAAAATAAKAGKLDVALALLKSGEEKKASKDFSDFFTGGGGNSSLSSLMTPQRTPMAAPLIAPTAMPQPTGPPPQQATEGLISAVTEDGRDIAPAVNAAGANAPIRQAQAAPVQSPAQPSLTQNPAGGNIPALMAAVSNPRLGEGPRAVAKVMLEHALKTGDLPPDQKDYALYLKQNGTDDFTTWLRKNKTAGATMINTAEGQEAAQTKARIAIDTHAVQDLSKKVAAGRSAIPILDRMIDLANKTPGGFAGTVSPFFAKSLAGLGFDVPEGISNSELFISLTRQLVPSVRDPGATSNMEQGMFQAALPNLSQSQEGRVKIARMLKAQVQRNAEIMQVYRQNVGSPDLDKKLSNLDARPMFIAEDRKALESAGGGSSGGAVSGAKQAPDGNWYLPDPNRPGKYLMVQ